MKCWKSSFYLVISEVSISVNPQQIPHSVILFPKQSIQNRGVMSGWNPMLFNGCRFTMLSAISECFTSIETFNEDAVPFALGCEGSLWYGWGLFLLLGSKVSPLMSTSVFTTWLQMLILAAWRRSCPYNNLIWILSILVLQNYSYSTKINFGK